MPGEMNAEGVVILAVVSIVGSTYVGDRLCRGWVRSTGPAQRVATAFLVGLLASSIVTYLGALLFRQTSQPLLWGNLVWLATCLVALWRLPARPPAGLTNNDASRPAGLARWDLATLVVCGVVGAWLLYTNLRFDGRAFWFGFKSWSDFGPNLSLSQSFVLGHNFPTEHPFFPGVSIRYHFLFWFQAANLSWLGLDLASAVNLLSLLSLLAVAALLIALGERLFQSRVVGRMAVGLFVLASSSLAYGPFVWARRNPSELWTSVRTLKTFLPTGFPYRGDEWGALSISVYVNQRHLISAAGLLLIAILCLLDAQHDAAASGVVGPATLRNRVVRRPLIAAGTVIGLLPFWNSAVFVGALIALGGLWLAQRQRETTTTVILTALVLGVPQLLLLRSGSAMASPPPLVHPGYVIPDPTLRAVIVYLARTFGLKWVLLACAWWFASSRERRWIAGVSVLVPAVFLLQLSVDPFNNHKLLNIWNVLTANVVAFALWRVWGAAWWRRGLAVVLAVGLTAGAVIDLAPVLNDPQLEARYEGERLTSWVRAHTEPEDVFLSQTWLNHPVLFAGRRVFLGYTLYAWSAGYRLDGRTAAYKRMFTERDATTLLVLLRQNDIRYVAFDDGLRRNDWLAPTGHNEAVFRAHFPVVFEDTEHRHDNLVIYEVPRRVADGEGDSG